jgi:translation initiation factor IF-1
MARLFARKPAPNSLGLASLFLMIGLNAFGSGTEIKLNPDDKDCLEGKTSMDVEVKIDGEKFDLDPSCSFSFSQTLKTKGGKVCEVRAGMCSSFSPQNRFEVECKDGSKAAFPINCRKSGSDAKMEFDVDQDCAKGRSSMEIGITLDGQKYKFDPSCSFSFSKRFNTKDGVECKIEAGMCSSFSPKNSFEVKCENGAKGSVAIRCP